MKVLMQSIKPMIFFALGCFLLWIAFRGIDLSEFKNTLSNIPLHFVFISMLLGYLAFVFRGLRWYLLIQPLGFNPAKIDLVNSIAFGYLFNSFIPRSGELARCTALNKVTKIPVSKLFGHVLLERLIDFILLALCIIGAVVLNYQDCIEFTKIISAPKNLSLYVLVLLFSILALYISRKYFLNSSQLQKIKTFLLGIKTGFNTIRIMPNKFLFFIYTILIWACYLFMTVICFYCFDATIDLNLKQGLFILVAGGLGMVVPTPTGIGSYHYLVIQALIILNVSRDVAQFFAIVVHSSQAIMIIVAGFFAMIFLYYRKQNKV